MHSDHATLTRSQASPTPQLKPPPQALRDLLARADVRIDGDRPWDLRIHDARVYARVLTQWSLGAGEAYVDGDWDCDRLDLLFERLTRAELDRTAPPPAKVKLMVESLRQRVFSLQPAERTQAAGRPCLSVGDDVYEAMLDSRMVYSCAFWEHAKDLEQAQIDKLEMICRKLELRPGQTLLDLDCGWGGLARFAAEYFGVRVTGVANSQAQLAAAEKRCRGLPVKLLAQSERPVEGRFDKIVSVGQFEQVGPRNYATYFDAARRLLKPEGLFLLHTIGVDRPSPHTDPWMERHVFPDGKLPAASELSGALEGRFIIEDWHNFGADQDRTLMAWAERFEAAWPRLAKRYDEGFRRMFRYYLLSCAGFFRSRRGQVWQLVLSGPERHGTYRSFRP